MVRVMGFDLNMWLCICLSCVRNSSVPKSISLALACKKGAGAVSEQTCIKTNGNCARTDGLVCFFFLRFKLFIELD